MSKKSPKITFQTKFDNRFVGQTLKEATIKGHTSISKIRKISTALVDSYISDKTNKGVTFGVAYHYKHMKWLPAVMTDISKRKLHDGVPLFVETESGREMIDKLDDDEIDEIKIYVLENDSRSKDEKQKASYKTPVIPRKGITRSVFTKK